MKRVLALFSVATALVANAYTPLDTADPVTMRGDTVVYRTTKFLPSAKEIFVDYRLTDDYCAAHPWTFNSFTEAADHLTDGTADAPMTIYLAPGVYWIDDPDDPQVRNGWDGHEPFGMMIRCNALHVIGLTSEPKNVVLAAARGHTQGAMGNFTMLDITSDDFLAENITMGNFCNVDLDFPLEPSLSRPKRNKAITQAHVAYLHGDRAVARNVRFISRLNMNPLNGATRILFDHCHMESTDDALTGTGVYLGCDLEFYAPRPFWNTHPTGAVFLDCDFKVCHTTGRQYFCKSVGPVSVIDCRYTASTPTYIGWTHYPTAWLRCYQSGNTLNDIPLSIGEERHENTVDISSLPMLEAYKVTTPDGDTIYNTYNLLRGDDGWDPLNVAGKVGESRGNLPVNLTVTPREAEIMTGETPLMLSVVASRHAGYRLPLPQSLQWVLSPGDEKYVTLNVNADSTLTVTAINDTDTAVTVNVMAVTAEGLQGVSSLRVAPSLLPAPAVTEAPKLRVEGNDAIVEYALDLDGRDDRSVVEWYKASSADGSDGRIVATSRYGKPLRRLHLSRDDAGKYLYARLIPAHVRSLPADTFTTAPVYIRPDMTDPARTLHTDFANFPTAEHNMAAEGFWTVGGYKPLDTADYVWAEENGEYWYYGTGINGARGLGLSQRRKGARLMYTPAAEEYGDMTLRLNVDPAKTAGQGFGSATAQYLDVALKFDTATLSGYALRIFRTPHHSNAVDFQLVSYENGVTTPVSEAVTATCYRTGCTIELAYSEGNLSAHVSTTTPLAPPADPEVLTEVNLTAQVSSNPYGGIMIQHTGSTGESATMLHSLTAAWK